MVEFQEYPFIKGYRFRVMGNYGEVRVAEIMGFSALYGHEDSITLSRGVLKEEASPLYEQFSPDKPIRVIFLDGENEAVRTYVVAFREMKYMPLYKADAASSNPLMEAVEVFDVTVAVEK